ncbi:MAG: hypothetical protein M1817_002718 [Caeruleum heppii]|nr:MAG: hypothetical protein M1817_002718 [Caeruleum heppii]
MADLASLPPPYAVSPQDGSTEKARFSVLPREEEGQETLPDYYCSLGAVDHFQMKVEMDSPFHQAKTRSWINVFVSLQGTVMKIYRARMPLSSRTNPFSNEGQYSGSEVGHLLRSYTLQHAEVGVAADYKKEAFAPRGLLKKLTRRGSPSQRHVFQRKRHMVIRIRVETDQCLLSCDNNSVFLRWLEHLSAAIDIAPPLDERPLPQYLDVPRQRRDHAINQIRREQEEIMRRNYPQLLRGRHPGARRTQTSPTASAGNDEEASDGVQSPSSRRPFSFAGFGNVGNRTPGLQVLRNIDDIVTSRDPEDSLTQSRLDQDVAISEAGIQSSSSDRHILDRSVAPGTNTYQQPTVTPDENEVVNEMISDNMQAIMDPMTPRRGSSTSTTPTNPGGKWCPPHHWTEARNLRYARRCMTELLYSTPRKSDLVVKDGQRWRIKWEPARELVAYDPDDLPQYQDMVETDAGRGIAYTRERVSDLFGF